MESLLFDNHTTEWASYVLIYLILNKTPQP